LVTTDLAMNPERIIEVLEPLATERRKARLREVFAARVGTVRMVMDAPHDPHNGAAVLRSCDAFGVFRVHVVERSHAFAASSAVAKGTERWVEVIRHATPDEAVARLRAEGFTLVGTHPAGTLTPDALGGIERLALVMGNEHDGISAALAAACDAQVRVPMRGFVESLNVSVTAAILLFHATASRRGDLSQDEQDELYARGLLQSVPRAAEIVAALDS
jgi:tRNA (guanosine-2'-O-)-methyltransferase